MSRKRPGVSDISTSDSWNWDNPAAVNAALDDFSQDLAHFGKVEWIGATPTSCDELRALGINGVEFASFKTDHPTGLASDLVGVHSDEQATEPGSIYRVDGDRLFTQLDVCEPLPFENDSLDWVYAEHLIEHISPPAAVVWLSEVKRTLSPGGLLRLSTPDLQKYVEGYAYDNRFLQRHRRLLRIMGFGDRIPERRAFMINQLFYFYGHRWIYDRQELRHVLTRAGFDPGSFSVHEYRSGSMEDVAILDQSYRRDESIYVEISA
jgi:predicted SAM-dependent methyltransferase